MGDQLARHNVRVVALSKDDPATAARHKQRDGLSMTLLSDPELEVIRAFGLEHHKAIEFSKIGFTLGGLPLALVPSFETMAIPTTLLIDEQGQIRWVDQSEDYRLRSAEDRVLGAVEAAFGA